MQYRYGVQVELSQQGTDCKIWVSHSGGNEDFCILVYNAV
jgi:hypothetical protein